jgi:muconolactone delta-isomerase
VIEMNDLLKLAIQGHGGAQRWEQYRQTLETAGQAHLLRLWTLPGGGRTLGLWQARDAVQMQGILQALPLFSWMIVDITPLSPHPSDPAIRYPPATAPSGTP